jgi:hypothetical protein
MINELDELIINLNIIATIAPHKKLIIREQLLNVEKYDSTKINIYQSVSRWINGESRNATFAKIDKIITSSGNIINAPNINTIADINEYENKIKLYKYLKKSISGVVNLKDTYSTCPQSVARIEILIYKIECFCTKYEKSDQYLFYLNEPRNIIPFKITETPIKNDNVPKDNVVKDKDIKPIKKNKDSNYNQKGY